MKLTHNTMKWPAVAYWSAWNYTYWVALIIVLWRVDNFLIIVIMAMTQLWLLLYYMVECDFRSDLPQNLGNERNWTKSQKRLKWITCQNISSATRFETIIMVMNDESILRNNHLFIILLTTSISRHWLMGTQFGIFLEKSPYFHTTIIFYLHNWIATVFPNLRSNQSVFNLWSMMHEIISTNN